MDKIKINGLEGASKMIFDKKHVLSIENSTTVPPYSTTANENLIIIYNGV
jgi:hypothetical protein